MKKGQHLEAAFQLHQATEGFYGSVFLVHMNYKPKTHDLDTLHRLATNHNPAFFTVFPLRTKQERDRFDLLRQAYVGARYDDYVITPEELKYLARYVELLKEQTETLDKRPDGLLNSQVAEVLKSSPENVSASDLATLINKTDVGEYEPASPCSVGKTESWKKHRSNMKPKS